MYISSFACCTIASFLEVLLILIVTVVIIVICYYACCHTEKETIYCYVCNTKVDLETWDTHRGNCPERSKLVLIEDTPYGKCGKCRGPLKLMKRYTYTN